MATAWCKASATVLGAWFFGVKFLGTILMPLPQLFLQIRWVYLDLWCLCLQVRWSFWTMQLKGGLELDKRLKHATYMDGVSNCSVQLFCTNVARAAGQHVEDRSGTMARLYNVLGW